jgi:hypothetical protein
MERHAPRVNPDSSILVHCLALTVEQQGILPDFLRAASSVF